MWSFRRRRPKTRRARYQDNNPLKLQIVVGVVLFLFVAAMVAGVWYGARVPSWQIQSVTVIGGPTIQHEDIEALVWDALAGSYFTLVPRQFFYTYPEREILEVVQSMPRVKAVATEVVERSTLVVAFEEYVPEALWCKEVSRTATDCMFLDGSGYAFAQAPTLQGGSFVRYVHASETPSVGNAPFTAEFLNTTSTFSAWLIETFDWYVTHIVYQNGIDIEYELANGGALKVTTQVPLATTQANLETLLTAPDMDAERSGDFEYIDLRFGDKVFIRDVEPEPAATSTEATSTTHESVATTTDVGTEIE